LWLKWLFEDDSRPYKLGDRLWGRLRFYLRKKLAKSKVLAEKSAKERAGECVCVGGVEGMKPLSEMSVARSVKNKVYAVRYLGF